MNVKVTLKAGINNWLNLSVTSFSISVRYPVAIGSNETTYFSYGRHTTTIPAWMQTIGWLHDNVMGPRTKPAFVQLFRWEYKRFRITLVCANYTGSVEKFQRKIWPFVLQSRRRYWFEFRNNCLNSLFDHSQSFRNIFFVCIDWIFYINQRSNGWSLIGGLVLVIKKR